MSFQINLLSSPITLQNEALTLKSIYSAGLKNIHIRKEDFSKAQYNDFLKEFPKSMWPTFTIHQELEVAETHKLKACHYKSNQKLGQSSHIQIGQSVHSIQEIESSAADYFYLSPVFNSISKENYNSSFSETDLADWLNTRKGDKQIYALGGIDLEHAKKAKDLGFDGCVVHGYIWQESTTSKILSKVDGLLNITQ